MMAIQIIIEISIEATPTGWKKGKITSAGGLGLSYRRLK